MIPVLFILLAINVNAQPNKEKPKLTPPKMESFWGNIKGGKLSVNDIHRLVD